MAGAQLINVALQHLAHLIGIVTIYNKHDALLEKRIIFHLVCALFQRQQAVFAGDLRQFNHFVNDRLGIKPLLIQNNT